MHLFYTGYEAKRRGVPFLLSAETRPVSAANAWLRNIAADGATSSPHTWRTYAYHLFDFFSFLEQGQLDWTGITNDDLLLYRDRQDEHPSPHSKSFLSRRTINARLLTVGRFYEFAHKGGFIERNIITYKTLKYRRPRDSDMLAHVQPVRESVVPAAAYERLSKSDVKWCPHEQVVRWLNTAERWMDKLIAKIMYRTGMRREEVINLKIHQLPERHQLNKRHPEVAVSIIGKGRKKRLVYLSKRDFLEILDFIAIERAKRVRQTRPKNDYVFVNVKGHPLKPTYLNRIFTRISRRCGYKITPHMLRHSFAVFALRHWKIHGVSRPEKLLQIRLGHSSITTTMIYMHLTEEMTAEESHHNASLIEALMAGELDES